MACTYRQHMFTISSPNSLWRTLTTTDQLIRLKILMCQTKHSPRKRRPWNMNVAEQSTENNVAANVSVNEGLRIRLGSHFACQGCDRCTHRTLFDIRKLGRERALRPTDSRNFDGVEEELAADYELFWYLLSMLVDSRLLKRILILCQFGETATLRSAHKGMIFRKPSI